MDRHKYVKVAYHGFRALSRDDRQAMYGNTLSRESYDEPDYALIDTLFSLAEAYLFMQLVDFKDAFPERIPCHGANEYEFSTRVLFEIGFIDFPVYGHLPAVGLRLELVNFCIVLLILAHFYGSYSQLYKDVRSAVDLCHRDGTLKQAVANEPSK